MDSLRVEGEEDRPPSEDLLDTTLNVWQSHARRQLSKEDARQIVENVVGFFDVLARWCAADTKADRAA